MSRAVEPKEIILTSDSTGETCSVSAWDPRTGSLLSTYKNASALGPRTLTMLNDSYILGADSTKPRLHVWPLNSQSPVPNLRLGTPGKVTALASPPNGAYVVAAVGEKLYLWQLCNGRLLGTATRHYQTVGCLAFSTDGSTFASGAEDGLVFVWSVYRVANEQQAAPLHALSHHSLPVKDLHFGHPGCRGRLCSVSLDRTANVYEASSGALLLTLVFDAPLLSVCANARESELFVGFANGAIARFDLHEPPRGVEHHVRVNVDANDGDGAAAVFRGHKGGVATLSVSVDCRSLLSGSADGTVCVWDVASRQVLRTIEHKGPVTAALFAKRFENFRAADLKPSLLLCGLQRSPDEAGREEAIEVIHRDRDASSILDFESYVERGADLLGTDDLSAKKLEEAREEIQRLKKINAAMYEYSVKCILGTTDGDR